MRDVFTEIWESIRRNKLRTCLTGFAVSWGIFMLIVLLGAGNGLMNAFMRGGEGLATNVMEVSGGRTSKPYDGLKEGRWVDLEERDVDFTRSGAFADHVDQAVSSVSTSATVSYGRKHFSGSIQGNVPARQQMDRIDILYGRFINEKDIRESRKVVVLPEDRAETLLGNDVRDSGFRMQMSSASASKTTNFDSSSGKKVSVQDLVGKYIRIGDFSFRVVGIAKTDAESNDNTVYAPYTTIRTIYGKGRIVDDITFTFHGLDSEKENEAFEEQYRATVNLRHRADYCNKIMKALGFALDDGIAILLILVSDALYDTAQPFHVPSPRFQFL